MTPAPRDAYRAPGPSRPGARWLSVRGRTRPVASGRRDVSGRTHSCADDQVVGPSGLRSPPGAHRGAGSEVHLVGEAERCAHYAIS
ncbi:hypothetical protein SFR_3958 [Streptomyces sp. FR-008]|nr:hypothetical protein SFR_3958 [Streptomyces sp. FR-008]